MRGENQLRPLLRKLSWWSLNVSSGPSQQALSASSVLIEDARNTHSCSHFQSGRPEDIIYGTNEARVRAAAFLPRPNVYLNCLRESAARISTSVDVTTANAPVLEGEGMSESVSTHEEALRIPFRRKGGDRHVRSRTNSVISALVKSLESSQSTTEVAEILEQRSDELLRPNSWPWLPLLDALQKGPKPQIAMQVFNWKKNKLGWEANPKEYAKMISFAGRISQPEMATDLFDEMERRGIKKTAVCFNALIHSYGRNNEAQKALKLFQEMKGTDDCQPTLVTYNTLISMYSRFGASVEMRKIFEDCKDAGFSPDRHTYNALIWGYMRAGQLDDMEETFNELQAGECKADVITYNAQIIGFARANSAEKMERVFTSMQTAGIPINAMVGEILVEVYSRMWQFEKMEGTLKIMDDTPGVQYGSRVHSMVIESYADAGRLDEMEMAVKRMFQNKRMFASPKSLEAMIMAYAREGAFDRLAKAMEVVKGAGWKIQSTIYNVLVSEYGKGGHFDKMEQVYHEMVDANSKPTSETYQSMVNAYEKDGNEANVDITLDRMRKAGFEPKAELQPLDRMWTDDEIFGGKAR